MLIVIHQSSVWPSDGQQPNKGRTIQAWWGGLSKFGSSRVVIRHLQIFHATAARVASRSWGLATKTATRRSKTRVTWIIVAYIHSVLNWLFQANFYNVFYILYALHYSYIACGTLGERFTPPSTILVTYVTLCKSEATGIGAGPPSARRKHNLTRCWGFPRIPSETQGFYQKGGFWIVLPKWGTSRSTDSHAMTSGCRPPDDVLLIFWCPFT